MTVARIICTVFEDALQLALPLSQRFDRVEIVEPGCASGQADFEINLQWCSLDEALATVSMLGGAGEEGHCRRHRPFRQTPEVKADAGWAADLANYLPKELTERDYRAESVDQVGNGAAAPAQHWQASATSPATRTTPALIKAPGRGSRLIDWLHRFCPMAQSQILP
jgi:hypothetical protein